VIFRGNKWYITLRTKACIKGEVHEDLKKKILHSIHVSAALLNFYVCGKMIFLFSVIYYHGKNSFAERFRNLARYRSSEIIFVINR